MWSTGEGNGKPLQYSCLENSMNSMKRQNDSILKEALPRSVGAQYATGDQWRNNSRKNEGMEPNQKQYPVVDVTGDRSKGNRIQNKNLYLLRNHMPIDSSSKLGLVSFFICSQYVGGIAGLLSLLVKCTISSYFSHHIYKNSGK